MNFILISRCTDWPILSDICRPSLPRLVARETDRIDGENAVSPIFDVSVRLSPECINGSPDFETLASNGQLTSLFSIVECDCQEGWTGKLYSLIVSVWLVSRLSPIKWLLHV